jgi:SAM-dependent methyltransferase
MLAAMPVYPPDLADWLESPTGQRLRAAERAVAAEPLRRVFGCQLLQVGNWGRAEDFVSLAGTARRAVCDARAAPGVGFVAEDWQLPVASHSVDAVLLPHTHERSRDPHQLLRECERVLTGGGRLIVLGFNPWSFAGLRRLLSRGAWPPEIEHLYSERRLRDWLSLLNFDVTDGARFFPAFAEGEGRLRHRVRGLPGYYGGYLLVAVKRVHAVTPLRRLWTRPARVPTGLAEPTTRSRL